MAKKKSAPRIYAPYDQFLRALADNDKPKLWTAISDICADYAAGHSQTFPPELAYIFHELAEELLQGKIPSRLKNMANPGKKMKTGNAKLIQTAVRYARAAEKGIVRDKKYAYTIKKAFEITDNTWSSWRKKYTGTATDPARFHPGMTSEERAQILKFLLGLSAKEYVKSKAKP